MIHLAALHLKGEDPELAKNFISRLCELCQLLCCIFGQVECHLHRVPRLALGHIELFWGENCLGKGSCDGETLTVVEDV